jgi:hypothetical protein
VTARAVPLALRSRSFRSDRIAWVVFLVALAAIALATRAWLHRPVPLAAAAPAAAGVAFRLPVLAYDRVVAEPGQPHVDAGRVAEHLEALRAAGFQAVTLRQVRAAYRGGAPLPDRPVLLTFDGGHLSTYQAVDPVLRRMRWPAVMFLDPRLQEARHSTYVYWDRLRRMTDSGLWELGTVGPWPDSAHLVHRRIPEHEVLAAARSSRAEPAPWGRDEPPVAFENALFGVNDPSSDPVGLSRVRVAREWSGRDLVDRLTSSLAAPVAASGDPVPIPATRWVRASGRLDVRGDGVLLTGDPRGEAWLAGGEWARDFVLEAEVRPERGDFWIVHRDVASGDQWRYGGDEHSLSVQRVRAGEPVQVVARADVRSRPGAWHSLRLVKRGGGVWVEWDGATVGGTPHGVEARWRGHVGVSTGSPRERGQVSVRNVRFTEIAYRVRPVGPSPSQEEVQALLGDAARLAAISPPGLVQEGAAFTPRPTNRELLALVAAHGAWDVVPAVELSDEDVLGDPERGEELATLAAREGWSGIRLVVPREAGPEGDRVATQAWARSFAARGLRLIEDRSPRAEATP